MNLKQRGRIFSIFLKKLFDWSKQKLANCKNTNLVEHVYSPLFYRRHHPRV